ncbi:MAG TPA: class I SAM-dependent methyltransferase, partial [Hyphomicrobiaceae bacterium]|nr:class I SAM-dependent methyltransferase [Hyphomicrobiaceae bacterium]
MFSALDLLLRRIVSHGDLTVIDSDGVAHRYGDASGSPVVARIRDRATERQLVLDPQLALGEAYMFGRLEMQKGRIYDLLELVLKNGQMHPLPRWTAIASAVRFLLRRLTQFNPVFRARRNVARHYDIDGRIYDLFLDRDRQYSCAYFETPMSS